MPTLRQIVAASRVELLDPKPQRPSYRLLLQLAAARIQNAYNEANNTHRAWAIGDVPLNVSAGTDEYVINSAGVGKILDVVYSDPLNVEGTERQIPFWDRSDLVGDFRNWDTAQGIAFYYKNNRLYAKVRPIPQGDATYTVSFNIGSWSDGAALDDEPFLSAHHHYFVTGTALDGLPAAEWYGDDEAGVKRNEIRRRNLGVSLEKRLGDYYQQFKLSLSSITIPRMMMRAESFPIE